MNPFKLILGFFTGGGATGLASEIRSARKDQLEADTNVKKLAADERMHQLATQAMAQTTGSATWLPKLMRGLLALPFWIYAWKLVVWDKVLKLGTTDNLSPDLWRIFAIIVTFYFLDNTLKMISKR